MLASEAGEGFVNEPTTLRPLTRLSLALLDFAALSRQGEREISYRKLPQKRWIRVHACSSALVAVA